MIDHKYIYNGESYTFQLDDSKGCYIEVSYQDEVIGYVGVALAGGTTERPYAWNCWNSVRKGWYQGTLGLTPDGLQRDGMVPNPGSGLTQVCSNYLGLLSQFRSQQQFKPEAACEALHEYIKGLSEN